MDMIPGVVTYYWLTPTRPGTFEALCAELCSTGHAFMRGGVIVEPDENYQAWLQQQKTFAQLQAPMRTQAKN
jgi:cytochrome c oxidase subunit 2